MSRASQAVIWVARHGESAWNRDSRIAGQLDPPLSERGRRQAARIAEVLRDAPLSAIHASPLRRARETAAPIARARQIEVAYHDELKERHFGVLQGRHRDERDTEALEQWSAWMADPTGALPGGESLADHERRVARFVDRLLAGDVAAALVVGHHHTNRILLGRLMGWDRADWLHMKVKTRHLYEIRLGDAPTASRIDLDAPGNPRRRGGVAPKRQG